VPRQGPQLVRFAVLPHSRAHTHTHTHTHTLSLSLSPLSFSLFLSLNQRAHSHHRRPDEFASAETIGRAISSKALELLASPAGTPLSGAVDARHVWIDMTSYVVSASEFTQSGVTCGGAYGEPLTWGTADGERGFRAPGELTAPTGRSPLRRPLALPARALTQPLVPPHSPPARHPGPPLGGNASAAVIDLLRAYNVPPSPALKARPRGSPGTRARSGPMPLALGTAEHAG
jgi:hypothetical protein